jgi:LEA14-like dessication related protein
MVINKKVMSNKQGFILAGAIGILGGISIYLWRQYSLLQSIAVGIVGVKFGTLSLTKISLQLTLKLSNPSSQNFIIDGYDLNIFVGDVFLANAKSVTTNVLLKSNNVPSLLPIDVSLNPKETINLSNFPVLLKFFSNIGGGLLKIKGKVYIRHSLFYLQDFPVDYTYIEEPIEKTK